MGVWIRSQGKGMLIYTNEIYGKWYDKIVKRKIFKDDETVKEYFVCDDKEPTLIQDILDKYEVDENEKLDKE